MVGNVSGTRMMTMAYIKSLRMQHMMIFTLQEIALVLLSESSIWKDLWSMVDYKYVANVVRYFAGRAVLEQGFDPAICRTRGTISFTSCFVEL